MTSHVAGLLAPMRAWFGRRRHKVARAKGAGFERQVAQWHGILTPILTERFDHRRALSVTWDRDGRDVVIGDGVTTTKLRDCTTAEAEALSRIVAHWNRAYFAKGKRPVVDSINARG